MTRKLMLLGGSLLLLGCSDGTQQPCPVPADSGSTVLLDAGKKLDVGYR